MWRNAGFYCLWCDTELVCVQSLPQLYLDDLIFDCSLTSMAAIQAEDVRASFLFVGDLNCHHQEWLGYTSTNRLGVAAFDFATVLVAINLLSPSQACGGTLTLQMTHVSDLERVAVVASIGNSEHSSLSAVFSMAQAVPNLCVVEEIS